MSSDCFASRFVFFNFETKPISATAANVLVVFNYQLGIITAFYGRGLITQVLAVVISTLQLSKIRKCGDSANYGSTNTDDFF